MNDSAVAGHQASDRRGKRATAPDVPTGVPGISKRGNRYRVRMRDSQGRHYTRSVKTMAAAKQLKRKLDHERDQNILRAQTNVSFAHYAQEWICRYQGRTSRGIKESTRSNYQRMLTTYAIPHFASQRVRDITPRDIEKFIQALQLQGVVPTTVKAALAPMKAMFAEAKQRGELMANPTERVRVAGIKGYQAQRASDEAHTKVLTDAQYHAFLSHISAEVDKNFFRFLAMTGLRVSEAIAVQWRDINWKQQHIRIERQINSDDPNERATTTPKTQRSIRIVPLSPDLARVLRAHRKLLSDEVDVRGNPKGRRTEGDAYVFQASKRATADAPLGAPLRSSNIARRVLRPARKKAGVEWLTFHSFRHLYATRLCEAGWTAAQVQKVLGHHSAAFTIDRYAHLAPTDFGDISVLDKFAA